METVQRNKPSPRPSPTQSQGNGHSQQQRYPGSGIELTPEMSFCEAGHAILAYHLKILLANEEGTRNDEDREALHQMRVATRRVRAALRDFRSAFSDQELAPFIQDIRWLARLLGQIRDIDVFIEWLQSVEQDVSSEMRPYIRRLIGERELVRVRERAALLTAMNSDRYHNFVRSFAAFVESDAGNAHCDQDALTGLAIVKIGRELQRVRKRGRNADLKHPGRLHRLRIEAKRLRYTAEFFSTLFPDHMHKLVKQAQAVQDALGRVHDATIHSAFLKEVRRTQSGDSGMHKALTDMIHLLKAERDASYRRFEKDYRRLRSKKAQRKIITRLERGPST